MAKMSGLRKVGARNPGRGGELQAETGESALRAGRHATGTRSSRCRLWLLAHHTNVSRSTPPAAVTAATADATRWEKEFFQACDRKISVFWPAGPGHRCSTGTCKRTAAGTRTGPRSGRQRVGARGRRRVEVQPARGCGRAAQGELVRMADRTRQKPTGSRALELRIPKVFCHQDARWQCAQSLQRRTPELRKAAGVGKGALPTFPDAQ